MLWQAQLVVAVRLRVRQEAYLKSHQAELDGSIVIIDWVILIQTLIYLQLLHQLKFRPCIFLLQVLLHQ